MMKKLHPATFELVPKYSGPLATSIYEAERNSGPVICNCEQSHDRSRRDVVEQENNYLICGDCDYYPWVEEYDTLEEATKEFEKHKNSSYNYEHVFLCEVLEMI